MKRRAFITLLGGAAAAWPLAARAQQPAMPVIGYLSAGGADTTHETLTAFHRGLVETGYIEGRSLAVEYRWAGDRLDRLPALAEDLVRRHVAAIAVISTQAAVAAKAVTKSIPIVFGIGADPVEIGLVASLNRPGNNLTGIYSLLSATAAKRLELMHELLPTATTIAFLVNPSDAVLAEAQTRELQVAADIRGLRLLILKASDPSEFEKAFATLFQERASGLVVGGGPLYLIHRDRIGALEARHRVPTIYAERSHTAAGGLMSYATDFSDARRQVGIYVGRILRGGRPADLPVQQVTKMQLVINMKTAKSLGITFPTAILVRADEVIE